jgi:hypothetical protein
MLLFLKLLWEDVLNFSKNAKSFHLLSPDSSGILCVFSLKTQRYSG